MSEMVWVGQQLIAETRVGTKVRIEVTAIEAEGPNGWDVWGYRVGTQARRRAETSYPRSYFIRREGNS